MEENIKDRLILILGLLAVILLVGWLSSCSSAMRNKGMRDKEMSQRMDLEERMTKSTQDKAASDKQISTLTQQLEEEKAGHQASNKALLQEQLVNQSLKEELQKVTKLKEALEENLKDALVTNKSAKPK